MINKWLTKWNKTRRTTQQTCQSELLDIVHEWRTCPKRLSQTLTYWMLKVRKAFNCIPILIQQQTSNTIPTPLWKTMLIPLPNSSILKIMHTVKKKLPILESKWKVKSVHILPTSTYKEVIETSHTSLCGLSKVESRTWWNFLRLFWAPRTHKEVLE